MLAPAIASADIDPPGPPTWAEYVNLYKLTLTTDQDDGINGETEILVHVTTRHAGHTAEFCVLIDGIDMDPPNDTSFTVIDGPLTAPERKGGKLTVFDHIECDPTFPVNITIKVNEVNSEWVSELLDTLGKALGKPAGNDQISTGTFLVGAAAQGLAVLLNRIGNVEDNLGFNSGDVALGVGPEIAPTSNFRYQMEYTRIPVNDQRCGGTTRDAVKDLLEDLDLPSFFRGLWTIDWLGHDEEHPFTKNPAVCQGRMPKLRQALAFVDARTTEPGTDSTGQAAVKDSVRRDLVSLGRQPLVTELAEGFVNGLPPALLQSAQSSLQLGDSFAASGQRMQALQLYANGVQQLLAANHPDFVASSEEAPRKGTGLRLVAVRGNPAREWLEFGLQMAREDAIELVVMDAAGRTIATIAKGGFPAGLRTFRWDGRRTDGSAAVPGVYFLRVRGSTGQDVAKFTLLE